MITNEQWDCLMWVDGLFARQKLFILLTAEAILTLPSWWWTQCTCTCSDLTQLPLGIPDLHAHSFPNWALNPGKERWKKKREKETKSYFYGKLRSDCGAISQVHLNKSIKAYPNTKGKKKLQLPLPLFFFAVYIWQSKTVARRLCKCLSKADWA